jgi:hypothetical protein
MSSETVPQAMAGRRLVDPRQPHRLLNGFLQGVLMNVMPALSTAPRIN